MNDERLYKDAVIQLAREIYIACCSDGDLPAHESYAQNAIAAAEMFHSVQLEYLGETNEN